MTDSRGLQQIRGLLGSAARNDSHRRAQLDAQARPAPKLVFVHVMKTAGTSINDWIQRHYHYDEVLREASIWRQLRAVPAEVLARKKFIRGHFGIQIETRFAPHAGFRYMTLLRDPTERVISHFWHAKRASERTSLGAVARVDGFAFEDFLDHPVARPFASNYQVRNFIFDGSSATDGAIEGPAVMFPHELGDADLQRAKQKLESIDLVGVTEDLKQFVVDMCERFGFYPDHALSRQRSYRDTNSDVTDALRRRIRQLNELDYELYECARNNAARKRKIYSIAQENPPMSQPMDASEQPLFRWSVTEPFFGTGWSDAQCTEAKSAPPHRWMVGNTEANLVVRVKKGARYLLLLDVLRFVAADQNEGFSLRADSVVVPLLGPRKDADAGPGGGLFLAELGPCASDVCVLTFHMETLKSFEEVNPEDPDRTQRGLALRSLTLVRLDAEGRVDLRA